MHRSRFLPMLGVLAMLILVLAACSSATESSDAGGGGGDDGGGDTGETVSLAGGAFSPSTLTIPAGTTVTFTDTTGHTVTEGHRRHGRRRPDRGRGRRRGPIEVTFDEAGTYNITCKIHPSMNMTITVEG